MSTVRRMVEEMEKRQRRVGGLPPAATTAPSPGRFAMISVNLSPLKLNASGNSDKLPEQEAREEGQNFVKNVHVLDVKTTTTNCSKCQTSLHGKPVELIGSDALCVPCYDKGNADILAMLSATQPQSSTPVATSRSEMSHDETRMQSAASGSSSTDETNSRCQKCQKAFGLADSIITFQGLDWHQACFFCYGCAREIGGDVSCFVVNGKKYCAPCHTRHFAETCAVCRSPIRGVLSKFVGKFYHPDCLACCKCRKVFPEKSNIFYERKGDAASNGHYCKECYTRSFGVTCTRCRKTICPVDHKRSEFKGKYYHDKCLVCGRCEKVYSQDEGIATSKVEPNVHFCVKCYDQLYSPRCSLCCKIITVGQKYVTSGLSQEYAWHNDCLVCKVCGRSLLNQRLIIKANGSTVCAHATCNM